MFCKYCGNELRENAGFCPKCGKKVHRHVAAAAFQAKQGDHASIFNLAARFPKDSQRYHAYLVLQYLVLAVAYVALFVAVKFTYEYIQFMINPFQMGPATSLESLYQLSNGLKLFAGILGLINLYVFVYLLIKAGILKYLLKLALGLLLSLTLYSLLAGLITPALVLAGVALALYANRKRWAYLQHYKRYMGYVMLPLAIYLACFVAFLVMVFTKGQYIFLDKLYVMLLVLLLLVLMGTPTFVTHYVFHNEQKRGIPFLQCYRLLITIPITVVFFILSCTTLIHAPLLSGDSIFHSFDFDADPGAVIPDVQAADVQAADMHASAVDTGNLGGSDVGMNHAAQTTIDSNPAFVPQAFPAIHGLADNGFAVDPHLMTTVMPNSGGTVLFQDVNGVTQMSLHDGQVFGVDNTPIGSYGHDYSLARTNFYDLNHQVIMSTDQNQFYYDTNGMPVGRLDKAGAMDVFTDNNGNQAYKMFDGTVFSGSTILGKIKLM